MENKYKQWLELAESDLRTSKLVLDDSNILPAISIYHSHQCVEKLLKAVLLKNGKGTPRVHNLNYLLNKVKDLFPVIIKYEEMITELNEALPKLRYPTGDILTCEDANELYNIAKEVFEDLKNI